MTEQIRKNLHAECPWRDTLHWFTKIPSTNTMAKELAIQGAPAGTVVLAGEQTEGRGRMGRQFASPAGKGLYLSVILRPQCRAQELMHLTCSVGVCLCDAIQALTGFRPGLKWINDLVARNKKLGGILTELSIHNGLVEYAIVGIGINCLETRENFPDEIADIATSLLLATGKTVDIPLLAARIIEALYKMDKELFTRDFMADYKKDCITLGREISFVRQEQVFRGKALDIDGTGGLTVSYPDGTEEVLQAGDVSVRGLWGYV